MKLFIYADPHWSAYSSIVRSRGEKYSTRLENLIKTMNWIEEEALRQGCMDIVCLGDFFDKSELNSEEITALGEAWWSDANHHMIVGNHEMGRGNLEHSSAHLFDLIPKCNTINSISVKSDLITSVVFLPYVLESNRKPLKEYLKDFKLKERVVILSHNDIAGIEMGKFVSTDGFSIEEIEENCDLWINGHLHNGTQLSNKIINLGNITGQNFSEDAWKYPHRAMVLDTDTLSIKYIDNPYAMNFYKLNFTSSTQTIEDVKQQLDKVVAPAVCTIKVTPSIEMDVKNMLQKCDSIIECRVLIEGVQDGEDASVVCLNESSLDHIAKFQQYILENVGSTDIIKSELERVSK